MLDLGNASIDFGGYVGGDSNQGSLSPVSRAFANIGSATTDGAIVSAQGSGKKIRVLAAVAKAGGTATTITFNTKPGGAGSAISALFANAANTDTTLFYNPHGWFETNANEGLTATTGTGSSTGVQVIYAVVG